MRFVLAILMLLTTIMAPTQALPNGSGAACDQSAIAIHTRAGTTTKTVVSAAGAVNGALTVTAGSGPISLSLTNNAGGVFGFLMYVTSNPAAGIGAHAGTFAGPPANSRFCVSQAGTATGSTLCHTSSANQITTLTAQWTPPGPGSYKLTATVAEAQAGVPPLFDVQPLTINVVAAAATVPPTQPPTQAPTQPPTQPPTQAPTPAHGAGTNTQTTAPTTATTTAPTAAATAAPTTAPTAATTTTTTAPTAATTTTTATTAPTQATTTVQQAFAMVLVKLKAVLNGTGTVANLKAAIQNLIAQIQAAVQKAKAAKNMANANAPVKMIVTKAPASTGLAAAAATAGSSYQIGFQNVEDANVFAGIVTQASSPDANVRAQSTLNGAGDLASQIQADPTAVNATTGDVMVQADQQVTTVTCPDTTVVSQDLQAVMCPAPTTGPAAAAGPTVVLGNTAFIGIIIGGVVFLALVVGGVMFYQRTKSTKTTVAPRV